MQYESKVRESILKEEEKLEREEWKERCRLLETDNKQIAKHLKTILENAAANSKQQK